MLVIVNVSMRFRTKAVVASAVQEGVFQLGTRAELPHLVRQSRWFLDRVRNRRLVGETLGPFVEVGSYLLAEVCIGEKIDTRQCQDSRVCVVRCVDESICRIHRQNLFLRIQHVGQVDRRSDQSVTVIADAEIGGSPLPHRGITPALLPRHRGKV